VVADLTADQRSRRPGRGIILALAVMLPLLQPAGMWTEGERDADRGEVTPLVVGVDPKKKAGRTVIDFRRAKHYGRTKTPV